MLRNLLYNLAAATEKRLAPRAGGSMKSQTGSASGEVQGFGEPEPGTYQTYRRMSKQPTIAIAKATFVGTILAGTWSFEAKEGVPDQRVELIQKMFEPQRVPILMEALRYLEFGFRPFEKVWQSVDGGKFGSSGAVWELKLKGLLPDLTEILVDEKGRFVGLKQKKVVLDGLHGMVVSYDREADNLHGTARHENVREVWSKWMALDEKAGQLAGHAASIIPLIHYPQGESVDASGSSVSNYEAAMQILSSLASGKGIALPNLYANAQDPRLNADLAGKSQWVISFLEAAGAAQNMAGMTDRSKYYDQLMLRGWLVPERAATEGQHGTLAESEVQTDIVLRGAELVDRDLAQQLQDPVDDVLVVNFGEDARGSVEIKPAPLINHKRQVARSIIDAVLKNAGTLEALIDNTDMDAVFDLMEIPKSSATVDFQVVARDVGKTPPDGDAEEQLEEIVDEDVPGQA